MDALIGHLLQRPPSNCPQFDLLPIKTQITYLKQENSDLKKSISQQQRLVARYSKDRKNLNQKVYKLENKCFALTKQVEQLELSLSQMTGKARNQDTTSPTSPVSIKITTSADFFTYNESRYPIPNLLSNQFMDKREQSNSSNLLRIPKISLQPASSGSQLSHISDRSHVKVISSSNKKLVLQENAQEEKNLKTLKSIRSDPHLHDYFLQKSQTLMLPQHQKPVSRKMSYLEKLKKKTQQKSPN